MPKGLKVVLILLGIAIGCVGLFVGGTWWWVSSNRDRIMKDARAEKKAGKAFGATHAQSACVDDALAQLKSCGLLELVCEATTKVRLGSCISVARSDGTCSGVPGPSELVKGALWATEECKRRGQPGSQACGRLLRGVVEACAAQ
jgi:hypothetical protein